MAKRPTSTKPARKKTLIVGLETPDNPISNISAYFEEFKNLVRSSGRMYTDELYIKLRSIDPLYYITKGKREDIQRYCQEYGINEVIISEPLSPGQERSLAELFTCPVIDRTGLILDIFERGAQSAAGKKQVALARLAYEKTRLAGRGIFMAQQAGGIGTRGPGETAKEQETRLIDRLTAQLKKELAHLERIRDTQRKKRVQSRLPLLCLVGYTNAGKSTILNSLTASDVIAEDKLFATLDPATRQLYIDGKRIGLISDTVGFIQQLPHRLIEAFKSTLSELEYATLLLQVIDLSDPNWRDHIVVVNNVLEEIGVDKPMLYVFNKIDKVENIHNLMPFISRFNPHVLVSATEPNGLEPLEAFLTRQFSQ